MLKKIKNNKLLLFISVLIVIVIVLLLSKLTYAYLKPEVGEAGITKGNITSHGERLIFNKGDDLALSLSTDNFNSSTKGNIMISTSPSVTLLANPNANETKAKYSTGIVIEENTFVSSDGKTELILQVKKDGEEIHQVSNLQYDETINGFDITGKTGMFNAAIDKEITSTDSSRGVTHTWEYTVVLINKKIDQSINETAKFSAKAYIDEKAILAIQDKLLADANKEETTLYYHNEELEGGAQDDSYRYAGADEKVKNFVCLDGDETSEGACANVDSNLYRIIGLFKNVKGKYEMKLIKYDYATTTELGDNDTAPGGAYKSAYSGVNTSDDGSNYKSNQANFANRGGYYWTSSSNEVNEWVDSELRKTNLNGYYLGTFLTEKIDNNLIETHNWSLNGHDDYEVTPKVMYDNEMNKIESSSSVPTQTKEKEDKIGLMYVSDYGYAASPSSTSNYTKTLNDYNTDNIPSNNWMYMGLNEWTISRFSANNSDTFNLNDAGGVGCYKVYDLAFGVRPSFYLTSDIQIKSGDGSKERPYRIFLATKSFEKDQ